MHWRLAVLPLVVFATALSAQVDEVAPGDFRCSAPAGNYFNRAIPPLEPGKPVTVRFKLLTEHPDPAWLEQAAVYFETPQGRMRVQLGKADNDQKHVYLVTERDDTGDSDVVDEFPITHDWIAIGLRLGDNGVLQVDSRGHTAKLDFQTTLPMTTEIHCHSGA
jgi:hypothetical protein